jgi:flagellin
MSNVITPIGSVGPVSPVAPVVDPALASGGASSLPDEAAALALRVARLRSEDQALSNVKDALNITATAEAAIRNTTEILARLKELALQSTSNTLDASERATIQAEFDALKLELARLATNAEGDTTAAIASASEASTTQAAAVSDAQDTQAALKTSTLSHDLILEQTGESVLAQANQESEGALKLLDEDEHQAGP